MPINGDSTESDSFATSGPREVKIIILREPDPDHVENMDVPDGHKMMNVVAAALDLGSKEAVARLLSGSETPSSPYAFVGEVCEDMDALGARLCVALAERIRDKLSATGFTYPPTSSEEISDEDERVLGATMSTTFLEFYAQMLERPVELLGNLLASTMLNVAGSMAIMSQEEFDDNVTELFANNPTGVEPTVDPNTN